MNETDIKVLLLNATTLSISMSQVETALKMLLLIISIGYTAQRWHFLRKNRNE